MTDNAHVWHVSAAAAARYADGSLPDHAAWSVEKHLEHCGGCATRVSSAVTATAAAGRALTDVRQSLLTAIAGTARATTTAPAADRVPAAATAPLADRVQAAATAPLADRVQATTTPPVADRVPATTTAPAPGRTPAPRPPRLLPQLNRLLKPLPRPLLRPLRLLRPGHPALRGAWLTALLLVGVGAVALDRADGFAGARTLLLALAPLVPVAGVALSYGPHADPLYEIAAATPSGGLRSLLARTAAVLAVSLPLLTGAGLLLPASGAPGAAAWLLPGLALTLAALALAGYVGCRTATALTGGGWLAAVLAPVAAAPGGSLTTRLAGQLARCLDGAPAQGAWAAAAAACAALLAARRTAYDHLERK
ncbi:zf-HC2 domain-containing protein [Streptomyces mangrovisoli]|uniref:Zinc-finger domain-containing protein n=1 Tax=Streptomyces mangrovisoli TaxID=1428628 RepID=A0A1J4P5D4_9ACTN|nr:zf-HC2 domain-containing protein [Streptomyces mangrovisoli]OIJ69402.1 hypothetical protein WN71_002560 [Streptomyces mangrovisoli]